MLNICTQILETTLLGSYRSICKMSFHVHVSYPMPSTFNYQLLFSHSSLLPKKKISTDVLCLRRFPRQPHKTPVHKLLSPWQHPEPTWAHWTTEEMERRTIRAPLWTELVPGWPYHLSRVHIRHQSVLGGFFPFAEFSKCKSKSMGLQSSLLPKHQILMRAGVGAGTAHGRCHRWPIQFNKTQNHTSLNTGGVGSHSNTTAAVTQKGQQAGDVASGVTAHTPQGLNERFHYTTVQIPLSIVKSMSYLQILAAGICPWHRVCTGTAFHRLCTSWFVQLCWEK